MWIKLISILFGSLGKKQPDIPEPPQSTNVGNSELIFLGISVAVLVIILLLVSKVGK